uniref:Glutathione S-transferase 1, isoform C n=1 Tax=Parasteatoda tepidariorum TaxID=114398 RepID=A0A2L2Y2Q9_PARTP
MGIVMYGMEASPACAAVRLTLGHLGIAFETKIVELSTRDQFKPEFLKINPQHVVPTIDDNGFILWESRAILGYLVDQHAPGSSLYPKDPKERAIVDRLLYFDIGTLYKAIGEYLYPVLFFGQPEFSSEKKEAIDKALGFLEGFLGTTSYVAGNHLTIADLSIASSLNFIYTFDYDFSAFPKITAWMNKMRVEVPHKEFLETPMNKYKQSRESQKKA